IENHDRFKAKDLEFIVQKTSTEYVGICLDTCNSLGAGEGIHEILPVLLPYTVNLHIKDFTIERVSHKMGFKVFGTPAGDGMLNIPWLLNEVSKYKKCKTATLELWMEEEKDIDTTIAKEKEWVEKSINYLKKYIQ
ncbi:MAG: TIM barrel protein, partial [Ginsengibacter sp.]